MRKKVEFSCENMIPDTLGKRIKLKRMETGYTQEQLADLMHVTFPTICKYENDQVDIKTSVLKELAEMLSTSVQYLAEGETVLDPEEEELLQIFRMIKNPQMRRIAKSQMLVLTGEETTCES